MLKGVSKRLCIKHIGVFGDGAVLACTREENTNKTGLFLIRGDENKGYFRTGSSCQWQLLNKRATETTLQSICLAVAQGLKVLDINGTSDNIVKHSSFNREGNMFRHMFRTIVGTALIVTMAIASLPAYAASLHSGSRPHDNVMPAGNAYTGVVAGNGQNNDALLVSGGASNTGLVSGGPVNTGLVTGGKAHTGLVMGARHDDTTLRIDGAAVHTSVVDAAAAEETGSDLPDEARVRMYDSEGNFIGWREVDIVRDDAGRIIKRTAVTFDKDGNRISSSTRTFDYTLDDQGNVASVSVTFKKDGKVVWTAEHTYTRDEDGNITERNATFKDASGNVMFTAVQTYTRDENGRVTESTIERKDAKGNLLNKDSITYARDKNGALTGRTLTRTNAQGKTIYESTRTFKDGIVQKETIKRFDKNGDLYRKEIINYH